jgi:hypothetical protein
MRKADTPGKTISSHSLRARAIAWSLMICALATGLAFTVPRTTAAAAVTGSASRSAYTTFPGRLYSVAAVSANDAWAAGLGADSSLIVHWNGKTWTIQGDQAPAGGGHFAAVAATSPSNAWAVGWTGLTSEGTGQQTLIERWNGRSWTRLPSPNVPGSTASVLNAVTAVSADNAWAVGTATVGGRYNSLTMHWNGQYWTLVTGNTPGGDASLLSVTSSWTNNIWAVGITNPTRCGNGGPQCQTLVEHWNGARWKVIPSPDPPSAYLNVLWGISAVSRTDIWAVGTTDYGSTLIVHWNGASWS